MIKSNYFLFLLFITIQISAQKPSEETAIKEVVATFFKALHQGDSSLMKTTLDNEVKIQTTFTNISGEKILKTDSKKQLLTAVSNKKPTDLYEEKLLSIKIEVDGNLASVWTPYEFYLNGTFSHCGANSFQLFDDNGQWKIIYLVDMRRRSNCNIDVSRK